MSLVASCTSRPQWLGDLLQAEPLGDPLESQKAHFCGSSQFGKQMGRKWGLESRWGHGQAGQPEAGGWRSHLCGIELCPAPQLRTTTKSNTLPDTAGPWIPYKGYKWKMCFSCWLACINSLEMFSKCKSLTLKNFYFTRWKKILIKEPTNLSFLAGIFSSLHGN